MSKYIYFGFALALTLAPAASFAQYYQYDNSYQIAQLQAQLEALRAQLANLGYGMNAYNYQSNYYPNYYGSTGNVLGSTYSSSQTCNFTVDLYRGMTHPQVAELNRFLGSGYSSYFDQATYNAVVSFQSQYSSEVLAPAGISYPTGVVGPFTRAKLNSLCNGQYGYAGGYSGNVLGVSYNPYGYNYNPGYNYNNNYYSNVAPTLNLYSSVSNVNYNNTVTLSWNTTGATSCSATGGWNGSKNVNGSESFTNINYTTTFTLNCYGANGGQVTRSVTVTPSGNSGTSGTPSINFYANPPSVYSGGSTTLYWNVTNANTCVAGGSWSGNKIISGNEVVVNLTNTRTYSLTCTSSTGQSVTQSLAVGVFSN